MYEYTMIFSGTIHHSKIKKCGHVSRQFFYQWWSTEVDHWTTHESKKGTKRQVSDGVERWFFHNFQILPGCREWKQNWTVAEKTSFFLIQLVLECNETRLFPTKKGVTQGNGNWTHNMWVFPVDAENWTHRRRSLICKPVQLYMHMI